MSHILCWLVSFASVFLLLYPCFQVLVFLSRTISPAAICHMSPSLLWLYEHMRSYLIRLFVCNAQCYLHCPVVVLQAFRQVFSSPVWRCQGLSFKACALLLLPRLSPFNSLLCHLASVLDLLCWTTTLLPSSAGLGVLKQHVLGKINKCINLVDVCFRWRCKPLGLVQVLCFLCWGDKASTPPQI